MLFSLGSLFAVKALMRVRIIIIIIIIIMAAASGSSSGSTSTGRKMREKMREKKICDGNGWFLEDLRRSWWTTTTLN